MSGRWQVAMALTALLGIYALVGMVDADEAVRDAAQVRGSKPTKEKSMSTYQVALDNTGLETEEQVTRMAELMAERGYDVKAVHHCSS